MAGITQETSDLDPKSESVRHRMPTETLEGFPLTEQQQRAWKLHSAGNLPCVSAEVRITGSLNEEALRRGVELLTGRHEILRTNYIHAPNAGGLLQVIEPGINPWREELDHEDTPKHFLCSLQRSDSKNAILRFCAPALSMDHSSIVELVKQLAAACAGADEKTEPFQYADYAQWQRELREEEASWDGLRYWRETLAQSETDLKLPLEKPGAGTALFPRTIQLQFAGENYTRLSEISRALGAEKQEVVLAVWGHLLLRMTGQPSAFVGVLTPGRTHPELEEALGLYDRYLPVLVKSEEKMPLASAVQQVQGRLQANRKHSDLFDWQDGNGGRAQPVLFSWGNLPSFAAGDAVFRVASIGCSPEPFKLKMECIEGQEQLTFLISFDSCRISLTEANSIGERFTTLLQEALTNPERALRRHRLAGPQEERILRNLAWSPAPRKVRPVLELFGEEVLKAPQDRAVACGGESFKYAELNERANQLANHLRRFGVRDGKPVGLSCERSAELVVGILGILKAGGAYVPLDPGYPRERLEFMVRDARLDVLVMQSKLGDRIPRAGAKVIFLDGGAPEWREESREEPAASISPDQLAYIIYTSGSTGQPKGVMIQHRNLAISTAARLEYYHEPVGNYLLLSSFAFDSSIAGIFWTLASGGTLTIPAEGLHQDPAEIRRLISSEKISHLLALPSFYRAILEGGPAADLESLRVAIVAGEACPRQLVEQHSSNLPGTALYNEYGPTEGTVWSTVHRCVPEEHGETVPIGRPVPGMGVYVLDDNGDHAGLGVAGEIHITGPTLASGYLNREDLSSSRFLPSHFDRGERLYRTGDLGRFLENGSIEFLGRTDHQVKIRGYRVELGEIEEAIRAHEGVREAVVVAREDTPGDQRLVAYFVPRMGSGEFAPELTKNLQARLPSFMVPSAFVRLEKIPLTPNGKVDRKALPAPSRGPLRSGEGQAPSGPEEEALAKLWTELLKVENVRRQDNFFDLGGHSLLALQLIARMREMMKVDLPLRSIFDHPTLEALAGVLKKRGDQAKPSNGQIRRVQRQALRREALEEREVEGSAMENANYIQNEGKGN